MSVSPWTDYLENFATYLNRGPAAAESGDRFSLGPDVTRPNCPIPEEEAWMVFELLGKASQAFDTKDSHRVGLLEVCRIARRRAHAGLHRHRFSKVENGPFP